METIGNQIHALERKEKSAHWTSLWESIEFNRYGIMTVALLVQSCIGGFAAMYCLQLDPPYALVSLSIVAFFAMAANAAAIGQASMKWIVGSSIVSILVSIIVAIGAMIVI